MEQRNKIDGLNNLVGTSHLWEVDFEKYDKSQKEHEQSISILKDEESKKSSEKIKQLTWELFNEDVNLLKSETIPPIEGANSMQILSENDALEWILKSLYEISEEKRQNWKQDEIVLGNITRENVNSILWDIIKTWKEPTPQIRQYLYKLLSDNTQLYEEILNKIWWPFILWANDRWNRWSSESRWYHMWVDYNLPKWTPVRSIYDWVVVGWKTDKWVFWDEKIIAAFPSVWKKDADWWTWNTLVIKHEIWWKTCYSLYVHITNENFSEGQKITKWQEIWKIDGYDTNGHWQPHLHFTIMNNLDNKNVLHWYWKSEDLKDMVDPSKVYN
jgi:hypothetical protein